jgi:hypothetical protein
MTYTLTLSRSSRPAWGYRNWRTMHTRALWALGWLIMLKWGGNP